MRVFDAVVDWFNAVYDWWFFDLSRRWKVVGALVVVCLVGTIVFWQLGAESGSERESALVATANSGGDADGAASGPGSTAPVGDSSASGSDISVTTAATTPAAPATTTGTTTTTESTPTTPRTTPGTAPGTTTTTTTTPATTTSPSETTLASSAGSTESTVASEPPVPGGSSPYPTNADGTPLPLIAIFDTETITLAGQVPSEAARERLHALAIANSQFPDAQVVDNMVVNPAVPISVGVRVLELNSARFPTGSAEILPDHASELDRVVDIMNALPNITVLVIGHADQRGDETRNFARSDERARAVVNYLRYRGISPTRLSSRAAGETDLLTIEEDEVALALNRRTEFIFYGLLVE